MKRRIDIARSLLCGLGAFQLSFKLTDLIAQLSRRFKILQGYAVQQVFFEQLDLFPKFDSTTGPLGDFPHMDRIPVYSFE
jgi:hypothetical protein